MEENNKESMKKKIKHHEEYCCDDWRSWGSWFSWGSPVGLSIGFSLVLTSIGLFLYFLHLSGLIGQ